MYRPFLLALALTLAGCLPYSCNREPSRALTPTDSLSRRMAEQVPMDTLQTVWRATSVDVDLEFPRTVLFDADGAVVVADAEREALLVFGTGGALQQEVAEPAFEVPFLAGRRGDTLAVFSPGARRIDFVLDGTVVRSVPTPGDVPRRGSLQYAAVTDRAIYVKALGEDVAGTIVRLDDAGRERDRVALPGPDWRHAGLLRPWGDTLLSLAGFRPVVDQWLPDGRLDTLALTGFDSPMLARSRLFLLGEIDEAPLLAESGATAGDYLFVLNLRPGWLHIDVYDRDGRLQHRLTQADPEYNKQFYPRDLATRRRADGTYEIAVVFTSPEAGVALYRWRPASFGLLGSSQ